MSVTIGTKIFVKFSPNPFIFSYDGFKALIGLLLPLQPATLPLRSHPGLVLVALRACAHLLAL